MNAFVFIETRLVPDIDSAIDRHRKYLSDKWRTIVYCSEKNEKKINAFDWLDTVYNVNSIIDYNYLLTTVKFWNNLCHFDRVLIGQHDSGLLREGIEDFMEWDYIGAPWPFQQWGGNGGLSLRNPKVMREICEGAKYSTRLGNEDVFFCNIMHYSNKYFLAPREACGLFSVESIFRLGTVGYHFGGDSERFLTIDERRKILFQYEGEGIKR